MALPTAPRLPRGFDSARVPWVAPAARVPWVAPAARVPRQRGMAQIEAMLAVVVFAIGVLGIVGMQARSVQTLGEATWRARAAQQADALIAEMRTVDADAREPLYASRLAGPRLLQWTASLREGVDALPGVDRLPPEVAVHTRRIPLPAGGALVISDVTVTVNWQRPGAPVGRHVARTRIQEARS